MMRFMILDIRNSLFDIQHLSLFTRLVLAFPVQILFQLSWVEIDFGAILGDVKLGRPQDSVDDQTAEIRVAPVAVKMCAGEAE